MKNKKLKLNKKTLLLIGMIFFCCSLFSVFITSPAHAQTGGAAGLVPCGNGSSYADRCTLCHLVIGFQGLVNYGFRILVFVALTMLIIAGIMYTISAGDTGMIGSAKGIMKNTLYGFGFVLGAWLIVNYTMIILSRQPNLGVIPSGGTWNSFVCEADPSTMGQATCTGTAPTHSQACPGQSPTSPTPINLLAACHSSSADNPPCAYECEMGYRKNGNSCTNGANPPNPPDDDNPPAGTNCLGQCMTTCAAPYSNQRSSALAAPDCTQQNQVCCEEIPYGACKDSSGRIGGCYEDIQTCSRIGWAQTPDSYVGCENSQVCCYNRNNPEKERCNGVCEVDDCLTAAGRWELQFDTTCPEAKPHCCTLRSDLCYDGFDGWGKCIHDSCIAGYRESTSTCSLSGDKCCIKDETYVDPNPQGTCKDSLNRSGQCFDDVSSCSQAGFTQTPNSYSGCESSQVCCYKLADIPKETCNGTCKQDVCDGAIGDRELQFNTNCSDSGKHCCTFRPDMCWDMFSGYGTCVNGSCAEGYTQSTSGCFRSGEKCCVKNN